MNVGEIKKGIFPKYPSHKYIWLLCDGCGKGRWKPYRKNMSMANKCISCSLKGIKHSPESIAKGKATKTGKYTMENSPTWKGGRVRDAYGYIWIKLSSSDFFAHMANKSRYILEHRLVMAKLLGRCLHSWEIVHHKNHIRDDNTLSNLQLVSDDHHKSLSNMETKNTRLEKQNKELKDIIANLRIEILSLRN